MKLSIFSVLMLAAIAGGPPARAAPDVVIGDIDDLTGVYSDNGGEGAIEATKMAIADFGASVIGREIVFLSADHQNKADIAASKARAWPIKTDSICCRAERTPRPPSRPARCWPQRHLILGVPAAPTLVNEDAPPTPSIRLQHHCAGQRHRHRHHQGRRQDVVLPHRRLCIWQPAAGRGLKSGRGQRGQERRRRAGPLSTSDFSSFLLQAQTSGAQVLGLANAGDDFINSLKSANEFGLTQTMKPAGLLVFVNNIDGLGVEDGARTLSHGCMVLGSNAETRAFGQRYFEKMKKDTPRCSRPATTATRLIGRR